MKEILNAELMRASDLVAINNNEEISRELMYKAALGVYNSVIWQGKIGIVCGKGNNGGDGYALALILKQNGIECELILPISAPREDSTAYYYYEKCLGKIEIKDEDTKLDTYDILVDALFGTGFSGSIEGELSKLFDRYNKARGYKVSIDINSGLSSDTGLGRCLKSDLTVSIGSYKLGHFLNEARDEIKSLVNVDIGIKPVSVCAHLFENEDAAAMLTARKSYSYKGTYGTVSMIGGCTEFTGAAKLASISASGIRAGCGISRLAVPSSIAQAVTPYLLDSTLYRLSDENGAIKYNKEEIDFLIKNSTVILYGMGTGKNYDSVCIIRHFLKEFTGTLILDAGGIRALGEIAHQEIKNASCAIVLTPHLGEMRALCSDYNEPLDAVKYAQETGAVVLLKGNTTLVTDGKETLIVTAGCAGMAKGGSGDVLSGIIAGLAAWQSQEGTLVRTVALGAYINGVAGEIAEGELCDISMCASDTALCVGKAIAKIKKA